MSLCLFLLVVKSCESYSAVKTDKNSVCVVTCLPWSKMQQHFIKLFSAPCFQEGADLAEGEGDGEEADQQGHEEAPDDQQEEQDEY